MFCMLESLHFLIIFAGVGYLFGEWKWVQQWQSDQGVPFHYHFKVLALDFYKFILLFLINKKISKLFLGFSIYLGNREN